MPPHIMFRVFFGLPSQPANEDHPDDDRVSRKPRYNDYNGNDRRADHDSGYRYTAGNQINGNRLNDDRSNDNHIERGNPAENEPGTALPAFLGSRLMQPHAPVETEQPTSVPAPSIPVLPRSRAHLTAIEGSRR